MPFATLARFLGALLVLTACSSDSHTSPDAEAPGEGDAGTQPNEGTRWAMAFDARHARLLGRSDGSVVVVIVTGTETRLRAFAPDGAESWSHGYDVTSSNLYWEAPEIAIGPIDETYLAMNVPSEQRAALGDSAAGCTDGCSVVAAFDADGEQRWLTALPHAQSRYLAALEDGVVVATLDIGNPPALTRLSSSGEIAWQQPWPFRDFVQAITEGGGALAAGDGAGGFYLATTSPRPDSPRRTLCGLITRYSADDGSESWHGEHCGEVDSHVFFSDVIALRDGAVAVLATEAGEPSVLSFEEGSGPRFSIPLAQPARLAPFDGSSVLAVARKSGPLAAIDDGGAAQWQWPGQLNDGALTAHPSGLCQGSAAIALDGDLYVLTRACASARALLNVPLDEGEALDDGAWLLARVSLDRIDAGAPRCGNGWLDPGEDCDAEDFAIPGEDEREGLLSPALCSSWLSGEGWTQGPICTRACEVDLAPCETTCGNGQLDEGEGCDGEIFRNAQSCDEADLGSGPLGCNECNVDLSVCPMRASCGNGQLEDWEMCDGHLSHEPLITCEEAGLPGPGVVGCTADCRERDFMACEP